MTQRYNFFSYTTGSVHLGSNFCHAASIFHYLIPYLQLCFLVLPVKIVVLSYLGLFDVIGCIVMYVVTDCWYCLYSLQDIVVIFICWDFIGYFPLVYQLKWHCELTNTHHHHWRHACPWLFGTANQKKINPTICNVAPIFVSSTDALL